DGQLLRRRLFPAGGAKDAGELRVSLGGAEADLRTVRQEQRLRRQAVAGRQPLDKLFRMRPHSGNAKRDGDFWFAHVTNPPATRAREAASGDVAACMAAISLLALCLASPKSIMHFGS